MKCIMTIHLSPINHHIKNKLNSAIKSIRFKKRQQKIIQQLKDTSFGEL